MNRGILVLAVMVGLILVIALSGCAGPAANNTTAKKAPNVSIDVCNQTGVEQQCVTPEKNETTTPPVTEKPPVTELNTSEIASGAASQMLDESDEVSIGDMY